MNKLMKITKNILLSLILIIFIFNIDIIIKSTLDSSILFFTKVFVCVFPYIILSDILIYYDYHIFLKHIFGNILSKIFNINPNASIIFILSIFTASPTNSIYIKDMIDNKQIDNYTAQRILIFTFFSSIPFVIGTIGISLYKSFKIGLLIYLIMVINNVLIGFILRKDNYSYLPNSIKQAKKDNIFIILKKSILKGIETSLIILGNLIIFTIIINLFLKYISINELYSSIICGILEMTNGVIQISLLNINIISKILLTIFILNFTSLSILFQSFSILSKYNINIKKILITKLVFSLPYLLLAFIFL